MLDAKKIVLESAEIAKEAIGTLANLDPTVAFTSAYNIVTQVAVNEYQKEEASKPNLSIVPPVPNRPTTLSPR